jgi:CBS domain-containing protein
MQETNPKERLADIARTLRDGESSPVVSVRSFLGWFFGSQRRGHWIVSYIRGLLDETSLRTEPDFESAYLDAEMRFELVDKADASHTHISPTEIAETVTISDHKEVRVVGTAFADPTYRVSKLAAANRIPVSVRPDSTLTEAATLMLANDFSQLPVMTNERDVKGMVSWKSIGSRLSLSQRPVTAHEAMEPHAEISADASLFTAIPLIVQHEYVLVRGPDQRIVGIVTTSDLSLQFQQMTEPFLLLGEIENHIRRLIGFYFNQGELSAVKDSDDGAREVETAADLTFGEYKRLLEEPGRWERMSLNIDRVVFIRLLDKVREIRNDVMHFDPDGIPENDLDVLRDFARFLRTLQTIGAT